MVQNRKAMLDPFGPKPESEPGPMVQNRKAMLDPFGPKPESEPGPMVQHQKAMLDPFGPKRGFLLKECEGEGPFPLLHWHQHQL